MSFDFHDANGIDSKPELMAVEIRAAEVVLGDRMQYRKVSISGGRHRVVEFAVVNVASMFQDGQPVAVEIQLADGHWLEYGLDTTVVVYRTESEMEEIAEGVFGPQDRQQVVRNCNQCGKAYNGRTGKGGGCAREGDLEKFPFNGDTGVRADNTGWMHGAHCSDECYFYAYAE